MKILNNKIFILSVCAVSFAISGLIFANRVFGVAFSQQIDLNHQSIENLGMSGSLLGAATKSYVDSIEVPAVSDRRLWNYNAGFDTYSAPYNPDIWISSGSLFMSPGGSANWNYGGSGFFVNTLNGGDLGFYRHYSGSGGSLTMYMNAYNGNVGIGKQPACTFDVNGTICGNAKNFVIDHPLDPKNKQLVHSTLEGPEIATFYRGEGQLENGKVEIVLPDYFEALTREEGRTVLLAPKFDSDEAISNLAASAVQNGKFQARAIDSNNPSQKFYWEVKAVRADIAPLEVERLKTETEKQTDQEKK